MQTSFLLTELEELPCAESQSKGDTVDDPVPLDDGGADDNERRGDVDPVDVNLGT